ncbi:MAG: FKBP-type peptidyl-prolyl cis-trans isomerase [Candidatus Methylacidiphilales bacterium]
MISRIGLICWFSIISVFIHAQTWIKTDAGTVFKYISKNEKGRKIKPNMIMLVDLLGKAQKASNLAEDTIIFNSGTSDKPFYIPTEQPGLQNVFYNLNAGDSIEIKIIADTFYNKVFSAPTPDFVAKGSVVTLYFHIQEALTKNEIEDKVKLQNTKEVKADSLNVLRYCNKIKGVKKLASGLRYKQLKANPAGTLAKKGSMVSVRYKGWLVDGDVFDENETSEEPFKLVLGMNQVIKGWEEGLKLMRTGEKYRLVIPWYLAYGTLGNGPIPPFTSIVFDVQLIEIK